MAGSERILALVWPGSRDADHGSVAFGSKELGAVALGVAQAPLAVAEDDEAPAEGMLCTSPVPR